MKLPKIQPLIISPRLRQQYAYDISNYFNMTNIQDESRIGLQKTRREGSKSPRKNVDQLLKRLTYANITNPSNQAIQKIHSIQQSKIRNIGKNKVTVGQMMKQQTTRK